ncbi:MAG: alpha/beta hydrolase [Lachnospiraceae bacterium]|nr:alpha/beta hydrolase [Lachnospiraceae bacterium]
MTAIVEYRHSGITTFPGQAQDTRNAIRFLRSNADRFGIDPERMAVAGDSYGGHTALWAALLKDDGEIEKPKDDPADAHRVNQYPGVSADVKAVINYYGSVSVMGEDNYPSTVNMLQPDSPEGLVMGGVDLRERPDLRKKLSVECNIDKDTELPPVLIFHGTKDRTVNTRQSAVLYRHLINCGKEAELYFVKGADHGGPEFWTDEILNLVDEFLQKHLK